MEGRIGLRDMFRCVRSGRLTPPVFMTWMLIRSYEGNDQGCTASEETLAADYGCDPRRIRDHKKQLREKGFLQSRPRGPYTPELRAVLPDELKDRTKTDQSTPQERADENRPPNKRADAREDARADENSRQVKEYRSREIHLDEEARGWWGYWQQLTGHDKARFSEKRERIYRARRREFSRDEMRVVTEYICSRSGWHKGENPAGKDYRWPENWMRSDEQVERHLEDARKRSQCGGPEYQRRQGAGGSR